MEPLGLATYIARNRMPRWGRMNVTREVTQILETGCPSGASGKCFPIHMVELEITIDFFVS